YDSNGSLAAVVLASALAAAERPSGIGAAVVADGLLVLVDQPVSFHAAHALEPAPADAAAPVARVWPFGHGGHGKAGSAADEPPIDSGAHCRPPFSSAATVRGLGTSVI